MIVFICGSAIGDGEDILAQGVSEEKVQEAIEYIGTRLVLSSAYETDAFRWTDWHCICPKHHWLRVAVQKREGYTAAAIGNSIVSETSPIKFPLSPVAQPGTKRDGSRTDSVGTKTVADVGSNPTRGHQIHLGRQT